MYYFKNSFNVFPWQKKNMGNKRHDKALKMWKHPFCYVEEKVDIKQKSREIE